MGKEFSTEVKKNGCKRSQGPYQPSKRPNRKSDSPEKGQIRRIARYLKRWRDVQYQTESERKKVYSIGLTLMAKDSFSKQVSEEAIVNDLLALRETLYSIIDDKSYFILTDYHNQKYTIKVFLPKSEARDFDNHGSSVGTLLRSRLVKLLKKCDEALAEEDPVKQSQILQKQFGEDFPIAEVNLPRRTSMLEAASLLTMEVTIAAEIASYLESANCAVEGSSEGAIRTFHEIGTHSIEVVGVLNGGFPHALPERPSCNRGSFWEARPRWLAEKGHSRER